MPQFSLLYYYSRCNYKNDGIPEKTESTNTDYSEI